MEILVVALLTSLVLSALLAAAALARTGLRGRGLLLPLGTALGAIAGCFELYWQLDTNWVIASITHLPLQILAIAATRSMLYGLVVAGAIVITIRRINQTGRRADIIAIAVAVGFGFGISTTLISILQDMAWAPGLLIVAMANLPMQICFALLVASAVIVSRFEKKPQRHTAVNYALALTVQLAFQSIIITNDTIGHWLAWLQPLTLGAIWLGLILLLWLVGIAVMSAQQRADAPAHMLSRLRSEKSRLILSPVTWGVIASLVLASTVALFYLTMSADLDTMLGRVMIYTVLAIPLLSAALLFKTAHTLKTAATSQGK